MQSMMDGAGRVDFIEIEDLGGLWFCNHRSSYVGLEDILLQPNHKPTMRWRRAARLPTPRHVQSDVAIPYMVGCFGDNPMAMAMASGSWSAHTAVEDQ